MDYSTEPEEIFSQLSAERYCEFYDIEMTGFDADLGFYLSALEERMDILELGCGSGRLTRALAARGHRIVGRRQSSEKLISNRNHFLAKSGIDFLCQCAA